MSLYERDFHAWANQQAELARARSHNELDWENVAEELDGLGKQQRAELGNRYKVLLSHLLKWRHQPERRSRSWFLTMGAHRDAIEQHVEENPSLKADEAEVFARAYKYARRDAARQTRHAIDAFPAESPFSIEEARDEAFWPEPG